MALNSIERTLTQIIQTAFPLTENLASTQIPSETWPHLAEASTRHGLAPLLHAALKTNTQLDAPPARVIEQLRASYVRTNIANWLAFDELAHWLDTFHQEQIPVILLKGSALASQLYSDPALRPLGDLDLLVPQASVARVRTLLAAQDYKPFAEVAAHHSDRFTNEQGFVRGGKRAGQIDVHWHLFGVPYYRTRIPIEWFWERTIEFLFGGHPARMFNPTAQLVHLGAHSALHHRGQRLLWLYDIALLLTRQRDEILWDELLAATRTFGLAQAMQMTLTQVRDAWNVSIPVDVLQSLNALQPTFTERAVFVVTVARESHLRVTLDGLNTPGNLRTKLTYWLQQIFPTRAYMQIRYNVQNPRLLPLYYLWRVMTGVYKTAQSAISVVAG